MALFKIFNNIDSQNTTLPSTYTKGYMYYDAKESIFYIDTAGEGGTTGARQKINAWGAEKTLKDRLNQQIDTTYIKGISISNNQLSYVTGDGTSHTVGGILGAVTGIKGNAETEYRIGEVNLTPANIGAATSEHTHTTTIATDNGTNQLTLAFGTKYKLTAGGTSYIFTMPANPDTNTDILVKQTAKTDNHEYKILMGAQTNPTSGTAYEAVYDSNITINPSSHALTVQELVLNGSTYIGHIKNDNNQVKFFGTNSTDSQLAFYIDLTDGTIGGVGGNDYAECRQVKENIEPGRCVIETGNGDLILSTERLQPGAEIISDTYNLVIGQNEIAKTPVAVTGRALAYLYEDKEVAKSHIGWPVCSGPNGTVSIMTEEEASKYPWKIIGTISEVPNYNIWKSNLKEVSVNERIWIRIK